MHLIKILIQFRFRSSIYNLEMNECWNADFAQVLIAGILRRFLQPIDGGGLVTLWHDWTWITWRILSKILLDIGSFHSSNTVESITQSKGFESVPADFLWSKPTSQSTQYDIELMISHAQNSRVFSNQCTTNWNFHLTWQKGWYTHSLCNRCRRSLSFCCCGFCKPPKKETHFRYPVASRSVLSELWDAPLKTSFGDSMKCHWRSWPVTCQTKGSIWHVAPLSAHS